MAEKIRHFTDLSVWKKAHGLFLAILDDVEKFPSGRSTVILTDQLVRSAGSISANIAEGFNRSRRKFVNSLDIALGEANETENWLYKVRDGRLIALQTAKQRLRAIIEIEKMLSALKSSIAANEKAVREASAQYAVGQPDDDS